MIIHLIGGYPCYTIPVASPTAFSRSPRQQALFCPCGNPDPAVAGLCRACYTRLWRSARFFDGLREWILERDGHRCQSCGSAARLAVHHRAPGENAPALLITLCAVCHARVHRLRALRKWIPEALVPLWIEQHPGVAVQLQISPRATDGVTVAGA